MDPVLLAESPCFAFFKFVYPFPKNLRLLISPLEESGSSPRYAFLLTFSSSPLRKSYKVAIHFIPLSKTHRITSYERDSEEKLKQSWDRVKLRLHWSHGDWPVAGDELRTARGRRYLVLECTEKQITALVLPQDEPESGKVFLWTWSKRIKQTGALNGK